jgi:hypothetical protein
MAIHQDDPVAYVIDTQRFFQYPPPHVCHHLNPSTGGAYPLSEKHALSLRKGNILMAQKLFTETDLRQIQERGLTPDKVLDQIGTFRKGFPYAQLRRPCTVGDGIHVLEEQDLQSLAALHTEAALAGRMMKFVPASGAATRMFKLLLSFNSHYDVIDEENIADQAGRNDPDHQKLLAFIREIRHFAFFDQLKQKMAEDGLDTEALILSGRYKPILDYVLTSKGLDLADLPKGLIPFHRYPNHVRTPFEEHLVEAAAYAQDRGGRACIHFTVSPDHEVAVREYIETVRPRYELSGATYEVTFSNQKPSTDTIAVDMDNEPFRDREGRLVFRPGGHGALLENLSALNGDVIFIKNIDNVVPDRLKEVTYIYKRALGGFLVALQNKIFSYAERLAKKNVDERLLNEVFQFASEELFMALPKALIPVSFDEKLDFLFRKLNRPLRVCGVVKNVGEPGGGPFWVEEKDGSLSHQIVEKSQVNMESAEQRKSWESATHFNPVDIVCGVRDYRGRPFELADYVDPDTGFISIKSKDGKELKALELPGLWNGSMAKWITVFVEVPLITFNPVKTVLDLLRKEHQPE